MISSHTQRTITYLGIGNKSQTGRVGRCLNVAWVEKTTFKSKTSQSRSPTTLFSGTKIERQQEPCKLQAAPGSGQGPATSLARTGAIGAAWPGHLPA